MPYVEQITTLLHNERTKDASRPVPVQDRWRDVFNAPSYSKLFQLPQEDSTTSTVTLTVERFITFFMTMSYIAIHSDEQKQLVKEQLKAIMDEGDGVDWVDKSEGTFIAHGKTTAVSMRKKTV